jgi:hypothetical protein
MENTDLQKNKPAIKQTWLRILLFMLSWLFIWILTQGLAALLLSSIFNVNLFNETGLTDDSHLTFIKTLSVLITLGTSFLIIFIFRRYVDRKSIVSMGYNIKGKLKDIVWGIVVGFILISIGFLTLLITNHLTIESINFSWSLIIQSFFFFLIAAIIEEIVFRGYILNNLLSSMKNKYLALLISSVLFAFVHGLNPNLNLISIINLVIAGLALGITYVYTKNLWFPIFLHVSWNYFQGPFFGFEVSGMNAASIIKQNVIGSDLLTGGQFGFEGSVILTILLFGMIIITDRIYNKKIQSFKS